MIALIGSREAPRTALNLGIRLGAHFSSKGIWGSSGGAPGMDDAWMAKYDPALSRIFLPGKKFYSHRHNGRDFISIDSLPKATILKAMCQAKSVFPGYDMLQDNVQRLFARNALQVLDIDCMSPVDAIFFWAPEIKGKVQGGTRIATMIGDKYGIPKYNLWDPAVYSHFMKVVGAISSLDEL